MRYVELTDMMEPYQSAYRQGFSTETALLQGYNRYIEYNRQERSYMSGDAGFECSI